MDDFIRALDDFSQVCLSVNTSGTPSPFHFRSNSTNSLARMYNILLCTWKQGFCVATAEEATLPQGD